MRFFPALACVVCGLGAGGAGSPPPAPKTYFVERLFAAFSMSSATAFGCDT
jgi:hypothetical protein